MSETTRLSFAGILGLSISASAVGQEVPNGYVFIELSPPSGSTVTRVYAINNKGESVGSRESPSGTRAVIWDSAGVGTNLGLAPDVTSASAIDINDEGTVLYQGLTGASPGFYTRSNEGEYTMLEAPIGYDDPRAVMLNSFGEVCGSVYSSVNEDTATTLWKPTPSGFAVELFTFGNRASAINDAGIVTTESSGAFGSTYLIDRRKGTGTSGHSGAQAAGYVDINNAGIGIVEFDESSSDVSAIVPGVGRILPFGCDSNNSFGCSEKGIVFLGGINEACIVVGRSVTVEFLDGFPDGHNDTFEAFVWSEALGTQKLADMIVEGDTTGWFLERAVDINDSGWIVGNGTKNGDPRSFLLIPREPCRADTNRDGQVTPTDFTAWINAFNNGCD